MVGHDFTWRHSKCNYISIWFLQMKSSYVLRNPFASIFMRTYIYNSACIGRQLLRCRKWIHWSQKVRRQGHKKLLGSFLWYWVRGIFRNGGIFCFICHFQNFIFNFLSWLKRHQKIVMAFSPFKLLGSLIVLERQKSLYVIKGKKGAMLKSS